MRTLLTITAGIEAVTGVALAIAPSSVVLILLSTPLDPPAGPVIGRFLGAAVFALGMACWLARDDATGRTSVGLVAALMIYNLAAVSLLGHARVGLALSGFGLIPALILHATLLVWCIASLRIAGRKPANEPSDGP